MYTYWQVMKAMFWFGLGIVAFIGGASLISFLISCLIIWLLEVNAILGWVSLIVIVFFLAVTVTFFAQQEDPWD